MKRNPFRRKRAFQPGTAYSERIKIVQFGMSAVLVIAAGRAAYMHLSPPGNGALDSIAQRQYSESVTLSPYRGSILDHKREPLAISIRLPSVYVNPRIFNPTEGEIDHLGKLLRMSPASLKDISRRPGYFAWIKRRIPVAVGDEIVAMEMDGLSLTMEPSRYYPGGNAAGQLIGLVGSDDHGLMGLEKQFNGNLEGSSAEMRPYMDARGRTIFNKPDSVAPQKAGSTLMLTIDRAVQEFAEEALAKGVRKAKAAHGSLIAIDPHTGRLLALANYPTYNPNERSATLPEGSKNHVFSDTFEPGSVIKPFVIAAAIDQKLTTEDEIHNCEKGYYHANGIRIRDDHPQDRLTTAEVITHSSNIGAFKIGQRLGRHGLVEALNAFGLGRQSADLGFPGTAHGRIADPELWSPARFATIAFGQGMTATSMEIAQAYAAIANGGRLVRPYIVDRIESADGIVLSSFTSQPLGQAISPETALKMRHILETVVLTGTGTNAKSTLYSTAGKTGTSQKVDSATRTYSKTKRVASFAGFAPVPDPSIVVYVVIDEPGEKPYYGGTWAAPVFKEFVERSLAYLNIAPDVPPSKVQTVGRIARVEHVGSGITTD